MKKRPLNYSYRPRLSPWARAHPAIFEAAVTAADDRWKKQLEDLLVTKPELIEPALGALTADICIVATLAELRQRGGGIQYIVGQLPCLATFVDFSK